LSGFNFSVIPFCWYLTGVGDVVSSTSFIHFCLDKHVLTCGKIVSFDHFLGKNLFPFAHCCNVFGSHFVEDTDGWNQLNLIPVKRRDLREDGRYDKLTLESNHVSSRTCWVRLGVRCL
jgi:hypothetical protein